MAEHPVHILVIGKTRVGKSAVINATAGKKVAKEGQDTRDVVREVTRYDFTVSDVKYVVWEAPGLQDITEDDSITIKKLKDVLKRECNYINLVIYCTLMNRERFEQSEMDAIHHLSEAFGTEIWRKAVFALTYANRVLPPSGYETDEEEAEWFQSRINEFKTIIERALVKSGVSASEVAVSPAGYHTASRRMPDAREFYGIKDWFLEFWEHCEPKLREKLFLPESSNVDIAPKFRLRQEPPKISVQPHYSYEPSQTGFGNEKRDFEEQNTCASCWKNIWQNIVRCFAYLCCCCSKEEENWLLQNHHYRKMS